MGLSHNFVVDLCVALSNIFPSLLLTEMIIIDLLQVFFMCNGPASEHVGDVYTPKGDDDTSLLVPVPGRDMGTGLAGGKWPLTS